MRMYDIIMKKRNGGELSAAEIEFFVAGYVSGEIPDYQVSALLMAIYFMGMTPAETATLTMCMANSGEVVDLSSIPGVKVDKHSTGGVGDKTTLIISPIVAALGVKVAKMSGRGLGHTGGTIDKLESIPGFRTALPRETFFEVVKDVGVSVIGQSGNLVPADKKLYALRDVTGTVESVPLIASSIMSKKIAAGSDCILLDVKVGSGAFMKTLEEAISLAKAMVKIGENVGRKTVALITDMDRPLGNAIGNSLEVIEACKTLNGEGPADLTEICLELAANMLHLAGKGTLKECKSLAQRAIEDGAAFEKLKAMVRAQGGDASVLEEYSRFDVAPIKYEIKSPSSAFIAAMDTESCGRAAVVLGAGRETKESAIDFSAGIILNKKVGAHVEAGETIATLFSSDLEKCTAAEKILLDAINFSSEAPSDSLTVLARVSIDGVEIF